MSKKKIKEDEKSLFSPGGIITIVVVIIVGLSLQRPDRIFFLADLFEDMMNWILYPSRHHHTVFYLPHSDVSIVFVLRFTLWGVLVANLLVLRFRKNMTTHQARWFTFALWFIVLAMVWGLSGGNVMFVISILPISLFSAYVLASVSSPSRVFGAFPLFAVVMFFSISLWAHEFSRDGGFFNITLFDLLFSDAPSLQHGFRVFGFDAIAMIAIVAAALYMPKHRRLAEFSKPAILPRLPRSSQGFTMIELLICIAIFAIVATGIGFVTGVLARQTRRVEDRRVAMELAEDQLALMRVKGAAVATGAVALDPALAERPLAKYVTVELREGPDKRLREARVTIHIDEPEHRYTTTLSALIPTRKEEAEP